ncbi:OsmC family protein [Planococcus shenhongbingii]|uniref:OsmC family protein n=1 Tax=Planococcus shenhongbingii TaxID=3058398 RepID=A0ABT8NF12_9BACL|nr:MULTISPECIES: OsmC family protein [unclassified Planococcus (in: firmicutes)]MDN7246493.1 OsmC family protein [Planococcus sp. N017]WKA59482.1 OsmC family protein [Planococcus sp. N016]
MEDSQLLHRSVAAITVDGPGGESYLEDGAFSAPVDMPKELGGTGPGTAFNPGRFLALGYSSSFSFILSKIMQEKGVTGRTQVSSKISLLTDPMDKGFNKIAVDLEVAIEGLGEKEVQKLADETHVHCPVSKAVRGNTDVTVKAVSYQEKEKPVASGD